MKPKSALPSNKWFAVILALSLLELAHFLAAAGAALPGSVYVGSTTDEAIVFGLARSVDMDYMNPWNVEKEENIFTTLALTSPFVYVPVGLVSSLSGIDLLILSVIVRVLGNFAFYIVAYHLIRMFFREGEKFDIAFTVFLFVTGLSGVLYGSMALAGYSSGALNTLAHMFAYYEFEKLTYSVYYQLYYTLPKITGMLSVLFLLRNRRLPSLLFMGLTLLLYPAIGVAFFLCFVIYYAVLKKDFSKNLLLAIVVSAFFFSPWLVMSLVNPENFLLYSAKYRTVAFLPGVLVAFAPMVLLVFYKLRKNLNVFRNNLYVVLLAAATVIFSVSQLREISTESSLVNNFLASSGLLNVSNFILPVSFLVELSMTALLLVGAYGVYKSVWNIKLKLVFIWSILLIAASIVSQDYVPWGPHRLLFALRLPLAISAAFGLSLLAGRVKINKLRLLIILLIISAPTILAAEARAQTFVSRDFSYYSADDFYALKFLEKQEQGVVVSSAKLGTFGPYISAKRFLLFGLPAEIVVDRYGEKLKDVEIFYSSADVSVLKKYNITYVVYSYEEKKLSSVDFDAVGGLEKIYDSGTKVYKVVP